MAEPKITPLARRLAEENGIAWRRLQGTGPDGTIVERDILAFLAKVMAGEVDLPPTPEEAPPLPPEEELKRVQEVLDREGVDLEDVLPTPPKAPTLAVEEVAEEELDLEPALLEDLDLDLEEDLLLAKEPAREDQAPSLSGPEEGKTLLPEPVEEELEELLLPDEEETLPPEPEGLELEEDLLLGETQEAPTPEPLEALEEALPAPEPPPPAAPVPPPSPAPGLTAAPVPPPFLLRVQRLRFDPGRLEAALEAFHQAYGVPHNPLPFLLKAAEKALAELELPLRPLLGQVAGEAVRGVRPMGGFLALFRQQEGEEGEGLLCFAGEEEVHSGRPSLFLSQEGVLAASGLEAPIARKLLERVALYLENPVLLLA
ncbi:E3 binding domain-containing protein [Thermus tenuipuniceus]|uniref:E3 binding domain-containing protein n=1 Tax=Thermus tenuipuniceus TaxID=2078690 RepID=UPI000CF9B26A|nr:E3 binding domain-containing protein [Thermus tenuipuniceus]